jgi:ParB/RepB/Spo0J family partition protein
MAKKFCHETDSGGAKCLHNHYPLPATIKFDLNRELEIADRIRPVDEDAVANMMFSLAREGQLKPILIRVWPAKDRTHAQTPRLIVGAHRVEAAKRLGWREILAWLVECDDAEAKQAEIDENLVRKELTREQRGSLYKEWLKLHDRPASGAEDSIPNVTDAVSQDSEATTAPTPAHHGEPAAQAQVVSPEPEALVADTGETTLVEPPVLDATDVDFPDDAGSTRPVDAEKWVNVDPVSEPAKPKGGRGKTGGIRELSRLTGRARNTIKGDIAAAEGKIKADKSTRPTAVDQRPSEAMKAAEAAATSILKDTCDRTALFTHLEQIEKGLTPGLLLHVLLSMLCEPARAA